MNSVMHCPVCRAALEVSGQERLESLAEHVSDPNGIPSLKDVYACPKRGCVTRSLGMRWNSMGETYSRAPFFRSEQVRFVGGDDAPLGSWRRQYNRQIAWENRTTVTLRGLGFMLQVRLYRPDAKLWRLADRVEVPEGASRWQRVSARVRRALGQSAGELPGYSFLWGARSQIAKRRMARRNAERAALGLAPLF